MKHTLLMHPKRVRHFMLLALLIGLFLPTSISPVAQAVEVIVAEPGLDPPYSSCDKSAWYPIDNNLGGTTYLTLNVTSLADSTNHAEWHPNLPVDGYYRVEAYISAHDPINWCTSGNLKQHDATNAHYSIIHAGVQTDRALSQYPLSNQWLNLGDYYFKAGNNGYVKLNDLSDELEYSTTVSFSAMRFTLISTNHLLFYFPQVYRSDESANLPPNVGVIQAQGFDVCTLPSVSKMQTWWNESPYFFYGLYLGGIQLPSQCSGATAAWVSAVHQQGWSFIPTWVGPQAPCSPYSQKMSPNPAVSYQQGRQEAEAASSRAAALGLTDNGLGGTIIYYDMEVFGGADMGCRQAAASFMNGWVERLGELGNIAGGYGSHNSYIEDWAGVPHVPKDVWAAYWYADAYDPYASTNNIPWLQGLWTNHQRILQYAGEIHDSWGGIGMVIDSDVADGEVAMPPSGTLATPTVISSAPIEDAGWLTPEQGWLVSQQRLYWTSDKGKSWKDISPSPVQSAYFLPTGQAWAFSSLNEGMSTIYSSSDWGLSWESYAVSLPAGDWKPLQMHFTSAVSGWLVLQQVTSQAFDVGLLLKTSDEGLTWEAFPLPTAGELSFTTSNEGWLMNNEKEQLFHTMDGGISWQIEKMVSLPQVISTLPAGTALSGWLSNGLGWAATTNGFCQGEKGKPGSTCQEDNRLWQSLDGGKTWSSIQLPARQTIKQ